MATRTQIIERLKKNGKYWYVRVTGPKGNRTFKTTKCTDINEAIKVVEESKLIELEIAGKVAGLTQAAISHITLGSKVTCDIAYDMYIDHLISTTGTRHVLNNKYTIGKFLDDLGVRFRHPAEITTKSIDTFINRQNGMKKGTRKYILSLLRAFCKFCVEKAIIQTNPATHAIIRLHLLSHEEKETKTATPYTRDEVNLIVDRIRQEMGKTTDIVMLDRLSFWEHAIRLAFATGLRWCDVVTLEWASFSETIAIHTAKTGSRVTPENVEEINSIISSIPRTERYLFPNYADTARDHMRRQWFSHEMKRLCKRLDVPYYGLHALRHGKATTMAKDGRDIRDISNALGHSNTTTTERYVHV